MKTLPVTIKKIRKGSKLRAASRGAVFNVSFDADRFERVAAALGMFSDEFIRSIDRAEKDIKAGRVHTLKSLADLL